MPPDALMSPSQPTPARATATPRSSALTWVEAHWQLSLAGVLVVALLVRGAILLGLSRTLYWDFLLPDERTYDIWARHILRGESYYVYSLSALPAYLVAGVYRLFGAEPLYFRIVNVLLEIGMCGVLFVIGRRLGGIAVGLGSALVGALYEPFALFSVTLLKEPLGLLLFALLVLLSFQELERHRPARTLLLGVVGGALVNVRQNAVVALLVIAAMLAIRIARVARFPRACLALLSLCAGFALATVPFAVANHRGTGVASPFPLGGFDLYRGNYLAGPTPYYNPVPFSSSNPDTQGVEFTIEASRREGRRLTLAEASSYWTREVLREAQAHPAAFARKLLQKLLAAFNAWEESDNQSPQLLGELVPALRLAVFAFWLVMPLGLASLIVHARRDRRAAMMLAVVLGYGASMVLVFPNMRIRAPLLVILIPYMVAGLARYRSWLAEGGSTVFAFAGLTIGLLALELVPVPGTRDLTGQYNTHGLALISQGRSEEAARYWRASSDARGTYSAYADLGLAGRARAEGDLEGAARWLDRIPDSSFAAADKYREFGALLAAQGRRAEAVAALERALSVNSADVASLELAIDLYGAVDPRRSVALREQLAEVRRLRATRRGLIRVSDPPGG